MNLEKVRAAAERHSSFATSEMPAAIAAVPEDRIIDVDVREDLRRGIEPFSRIMQAQITIPEQGVMRLRATFEPIPLYTVLGKHGFTHWTERLADDDWRVWFYRGDVDAAADDDLVILDVRGLEPPEPMTRTLEALEELPAGKSLLQVNARVPQFLLPLLEERGFEYVLVSEQPNEVRGLIRRPNPTGSNK
jgi:TusA-related sulfurtransferase